MKSENNLGFCIFRLVMYALIFGLLLKSYIDHPWTRSAGKLGLTILAGALVIFSICSLVYSVKKRHNKNDKQ